MVRFHYHVFGLHLCTNRAVPGLVAVRCPLQADTIVTFVENGAAFPLQKVTRTWFASPAQPTGRPPNVIVWMDETAHSFRFRYADGAEFMLDGKGHHIWAASDSADVETLAIYLLSPILGFVLRLRGSVSLHGSAMGIRGNALAFVGPHGSGKSTLAAAFAQLGHPLLSEDNVTLAAADHQWLVHSGFPRVRLRPSAVEALYGSPDALPQTIAHWDKRHLDLIQPGYGFQAEPLPLAAIYLLGARSDNPRAPFIEPISAREGLISLVANARENLMLTSTMRATELNLLSQVVRGVPLRRVTPHADFERLSKLCLAILDDFENLSRDITRRRAG